MKDHFTRFYANDSLRFFSTLAQHPESDPVRATRLARTDEVGIPGRMPLVLSALLWFVLPVMVLGQGLSNPTAASKLSPGNPASPATSTQGPSLPAALARGILEEEGNLNLRAAMKNYQEVVVQFDEQRRYAATALFRLGECYRKLGQTNEAQAQYQRIIREFPDQSELVRLSQALVPTTQGGPTLALGQPDAELERIKALSQQSPDLINASGKNRETLLQAAAGKGQIEVVRYLLDHGAAVNGLKQPELTALHFAAGNGRLAVVELLLRRGAKVEALTESGVTPLHLAAQKGYGHVAKALLDAGAPLNVVISRDVNWDNADLQYNLSSGASPLDIAVVNGYANIVELLLDGGANVNARAVSGATPLHVAAGRGQAPLVEVLLHHGASLNAKDNAGNTPLHLAAANGDLATLKALVDAKAEVNARDSTGGTPLLAAARNRKREAAEALLAHGAEPNLATTFAPLHVAVAYGDELLTRDLLERGADADLQAAHRPYLIDSTGLGFADPGTAIETACELGNVGLAKLLLDRGANPNTRRTGDDLPLLAFQSVWSPSELLQLLLAHKADPNLANKQGERPLHFVVQYGSTNSLALLVEHGADVNARIASGATPLHYAVAAGRLDMVEALLAAKAEPNLTDDQGRTPLDMTKANWETLRTSTGPISGRTIPRIDPSTRNPFIATQTQALAASPQRSGSAEISTALRRAGALEEIPHLDRIEMRRQSAQYSQVLFRKGTNDSNHFTVLELIAAWYGLISTSQDRRTNDRYEASAFARKYSHLYDRYPDFTHLIIRRPTKDGRQWTEQQIDLSGTFRSGDCAGDIPLQWGDVVDIPEADHPLNESWPGLSVSVLTTLKKCLTRHLEISVKGQINPFALSLDIDFKDDGQPDSIGPEVPFMVRPALLRSNLILSSSDLTRVKVSRADPATGQTREWVLNCSDAKTAPDFWLRDGDRIDLPEK